MLDGEDALDATPGATPLDDISGLRQRHIRTRAELNAAEAENIRMVVVRYLIARSPAHRVRFDVRWFRSLHRQMLGRVWSWAGEFRKTQTNIGVPPASIEPSLSELAQDLSAWREASMPLPEQSARLHHRALLVHPFPNGNGRWARMLANVWRRQHRHPIVEWPEATLGGASIARDDYLAAVRAADGGDLRPLIEMEERFQLRL